MKYNLKFNNDISVYRYRASRSSLPEDFGGNAPAICVGFVLRALGERLKSFVLEVSTQPFAGSKQLLIKKTLYNPNRFRVSPYFIYTYYFPQNRCWQEFYYETYDLLSYLTKKMQSGNRRIYIKLSA